MAGNQPGFDAAGFRDAIHFAMTMAAPQDPTHRLTFRWSDVDSYAIADPATRPYDWTETPATQTIVPDLQVDCAFRFAGTNTDQSNPVGTFNEARIIVTLLDVDYDAIVAHGGRFADIILADDNAYDVKMIPPPVGLFDVTVWEVVAEARDET